MKHSKEIGHEPKQLKIEVNATAARERRPKKTSYLPYSMQLPKWKPPDKLEANDANSFLTPVARASCPMLS